MNIIMPLILMLLITLLAPFIFIYMMGYIYFTCILTIYGELQQYKACLFPKA